VNYDPAEDISWCEGRSHLLLVAMQVADPIQQTVAQVVAQARRRIIKDTAYGFIDDEALSRGAAIAFYTATSIAPVLLIIVAIAGLAFGEEAAQNAITDQLSGLVGGQTAQLLQTAVASASKKSSGTLATLVGLVTLVLTASGVFGEMQSALNAIWKAKPSEAAITRLIRARAVSLGLVAAQGFLLLSLVVSAMLTAFGNQLNAIVPFGKLILSGLDLLVSFVLISLLFAAIYKILPDRPLAWRDVILGAVVTTTLFTAGKSLIAFYIGSSATVSSYGAAGALIALLLWVYYSAQIFPLGAEFMKAYANYRNLNTEDGRQRS
jgi:membrane protein